MFATINSIALDGVTGGRGDGNDTTVPNECPDIKLRRSGVRILPGIYNAALREYTTGNRGISPNSDDRFLRLY